jgi:hypothetical protein
VDCEDCGGRKRCERRERSGGDREGRGAEGAEVAERRERCGSDREGKGAEVAEGRGNDREGRGAEVAVSEAGLKLRAWRRGSSCRRWGSALLDLQHFFAVIYLVNGGEGGERR